MSKVTSLHGIAVAKAGVADERIVRALRKVLEMAESGQIVGICIVGQTDEAPLWTDGGAICRTDGDARWFIGCLEQVKAEIVEGLAR